MRHSKLVGAVSNCAVSTYHGPYAVRLKTAPTGGESVHLFLESTIVCGLDRNLTDCTTKDHLPTRRRFNELIVTILNISISCIALMDQNTKPLRQVLTTGKLVLV